jgi:HD-like signal output (HDOD) protein
MEEKPRTSKSFGAEESRNEIMAGQIEDFINPQLEARLTGLGRLAAPSKITMALMGMLQDERTTPKQLQKLVEQDPALSSKVISLGNSSFYGLAAQVKTIAGAITVIGFRELQFLALGMGLADTFDLSRAPDGFNGEALWVHSLSVAWVAGEAAQASGLAAPSEAMLAGILHNIGQIALVTQFSAQLRTLMKAVAEGQTFLEAETGLGLSHEILGRILAKNWGIPQCLQDVIYYHHRPWLSPVASRIQVDVVSMALDLVDHTEYRLDHERPFPPESAYCKVLPQWSLSEKEKLLEKAIDTLPLMAPSWLRMITEPPSGPPQVGKNQKTGLES